MRRMHTAVVLLAAGLLAASCSHAWDDYDPRLGGAGGGAAATTTGGPGSPTSSSSTEAAVVGSSSGGDTTSTGGDGGNGDGGAGPTAGSTSDGTGASSSESASSGSPTETLEIEAVEADCTDSDDPDADDCDFDAASNSFTIDADASKSFHEEWIGYVRFSPGGELAGKTVDAVKLRMFVANEERADSDDSGVIWESEPFERDDLDDDAPSWVGDAPVGASVGPVDLGQEVTFDLVGVTVQAGTPLYFAVDTDSMDGVDYLDERSATPPTLIVTYH